MSKTAYAPPQPVSAEVGGVLYHGTYRYEHGMVKVTSDYGSGHKVIHSSPDQAELWAKQGLREMIREHDRGNT